MGLRPFLFQALFSGTLFRRTWARTRLPLGIYGFCGCQPGLVFQWEPTKMRRKPAPHESPAPHLCKKQGAKVGQPAEGWATRPATSCVVRRKTPSGSCDQDRKEDYKSHDLRESEKRLALLVRFRFQQ